MSPSRYRNGEASQDADTSPAIRSLLNHVSEEEIPADDCLLSAEMLEARLTSLDEPPLTLIAAGDIMLGGRARRLIKSHGADYPFRAVLPLLRRSPIVLANLEGPFAAKAKKLPRRYSYRVKPRLAGSLANAGINVVTLANNHLLDCGRSGVIETLDALESAGVGSIGGGINAAVAHMPAICAAGNLRIGLLGYYWNSRCAATRTLPGSAMDTYEAIESDIQSLRNRADRIVVAFHWGEPYERGPAPEERAKARFAIDCGADLVVGHHQHIVQPFEIYRDRPIFYGIGNFAFGSGNSRAEGLLVGVRFDDRSTLVNVLPLYVKNRDPRVSYQPKLLRGRSAERILSRLAQISESHGRMLRVVDGRGIIGLGSA